MDSVREFCDRAALILNSKIEVIGSVDKAVQRYNEINFGDAKKETGILEVGSTRWGNGDVKIKEVKIEDLNGKAKSTFKTGDDLQISIKYKVNKPIDKPNIGISIFREDGIYCFDINTDLDQVSPKKLEKDGEVTLVYKNMMLQKGNYYFKVGFYRDYWKETLDFIDLGPEFKVVDPENKQHGVVYIDHEWNLK
jgi:ABC-2 type transport system ATP-binding protein